MRQATLHIEGMSCGHCLNAVNRALSAVPGVQIDAIRIGRADVRYDEANTALAARGRGGRRRLSGLCPGFGGLTHDRDAATAPSSCTIPVQGMTCAACSARVQRSLERTPGVSAANVNLMTGSATVCVRPGRRHARAAGRGHPGHRVRRRAPRAGREGPGADRGPGRGAGRRDPRPPAEARREPRRRGGRDGAQHPARGARGAECDRSADAHS